MLHSRLHHILVVDDSRTNRLVLKGGLEAEGHEILEAETGARALELLEPTLQRPPGAEPIPEQIDLVILDVMMPEIDGLEVLRTIRRSKSRAELPVIMATALDAPENVVTALRDGANDYVMKPVHLPGLLARVETHLDLRATHRALQDAQHSLIRAARMESIGYLAAGLAHEIRNPLARINLATQGLQRNPAVAADEKLTRSVDTIASSLDQANAVVQGLMQFSREEQLALESGDVHRGILDALAALQNKIREAGVAVATEFASDLPPALLAVNEFTQVLVGIFLNAIQAMDRGGILAVRTSLQRVENLPSETGSRTGNRIRQGDEVITIEIRDTGPGLSEEQLLKVFDAFYSTKATGAATGMGLTVARKLIELHGGMLELTNRDRGRGVRVAIRLRKAGSFQTSV